ncbi:hypothetical protein GJAV_G00003660 [Gymnothorax javanicus]|nr:hypothetical protein GJAV_G00003660 [Gymnothorax javanicus]
MVLSTLPKNMGFLLFLLLQLDCVDLLQINQSPLDLVLHPGSPMKISCSVHGTSNPYIYWYQWTLTEGIRAIFYSVVPGSVEPPEVNAFSARRPNGTHFVLESAGVAEAELPAVWYCAGSIHSDKNSASRRMVLSTLPKNMGFLLFLLLQLDCVDLLQINQSPLDLVLYPGSPMKISCSVHGTTNPYIYWYQWTLTEGIRAIFYSVGPETVEPPEANAFSARRPNGTHFVLESAGVAEAEPPAVWYCAGSIHSDKMAGNSIFTSRDCETAAEGPV